MFLLITLVKCWLRVMHEGRSSIRHSNSFLDSFPFTMWLVIGSGFGLTVTWAVCGADRRLESMSMMSSLKDLALLANLPFLTLSIAAHSIDRLRLETRQFWRQTPFLVVSYGITTSCYVGIGTLNCTAGAIRNNGKKKNNVWKNDGETSKTLRILLESEGAAATCTIQSQMRISFVHQGFKIGGSNMTWNKLCSKRKKENRKYLHTPPSRLQNSQGNVAINGRLSTHFRGRIFVNALGADEEIISCVISL